VASVGLLTSRSLPFVTANSAIKVFRHALSLDEVCQILFSLVTNCADRSPQRRAKFKPNHYQLMALDQNTAGCQKLDHSEASGTLTNSNSNGKRSHERKSKAFSPFHFRRTPPHKACIKTEEINDKCDVLEVWFAGCHEGM